MTLMQLDPVLARRDEIHRIAASSLRRRLGLSRVAIAVCTLFLVVALIPLVLLLVFVIGKGASAWDVAFFTHLPTPAGIPGGGISNAIIGSLIIDGIAAAGAIPFGLVIGLALAEANGRIASGIRFAADVLAGVPSITLGIFAYALARHDPRALLRRLGQFRPRDLDAPGHHPRQRDRFSNRAGCTRRGRALARRSARRASPGA